MKKIIKTGIIVSLSSISILASAEYIMKIPVDADIRFVPANTSAPEKIETPVVQEPVVEEIWTTTDPVISEWVDSEEPYECSEWLPATNTVSTGKEFTQSAECKQNQTRTVQYYETSNTGQTRKVGDEIAENQVVDTTEERNSLGTRYTHVITIGRYYVDSNDRYHGYFSEDYISRYFSQDSMNRDQMLANNPGSISPTTFKGYTIDHFVQEQATITFRLLPAHNSPALNPVVTFNGKDCQLYGPSIYSSYDAICNYNLEQYAGQTFNLDIR